MQIHRHSSSREEHQKHVRSPRSPNLNWLLVGPSRGMALKESHWARRLPTPEGQDTHARSSDLGFWTTGRFRGHLRSLPQLRVPVQAHRRIGAFLKIFLKIWFEFSKLLALISLFVKALQMGIAFLRNYKWIYLSRCAIVICLERQSKSVKGIAEIAQINLINLILFFRRKL